MGRAAPCVRAEQGKATRRVDSRSGISGKTGSSDITELHVAHSLFELTVTAIYRRVWTCYTHPCICICIVHVVHSFLGPAPFWKRG